MNSRGGAFPNAKTYVSRYENERSKAHKTGTRTPPLRPVTSASVVRAMVAGEAYPARTLRYTCDPHPRCGIH